MRFTIGTIQFVVIALLITSINSFSQYDPKVTFQGKIGKTPAETTQWYQERLKAPKGAPNIIWILLDDGIVKLRGIRLTYPLVSKWIIEFNKEYPNINVAIAPTAPANNQLLVEQKVIATSAFKISSSSCEGANELMKKRKLKQVNN